MMRALLPLAVAASLALGIGDVEKGNRLYREGRYLEAAAAYRAALQDGVDSPVLHYNLGTTLLQLGQLDEAEVHLRRALRDVEPSMRQRAVYNLGNRYLIDARRTGGAEAAAHFAAAIEAYREALRLDPDDYDAKFNLELALREQDEQEQQQSSGGGGGAEQDDEQQDQDRDEGGGGGSNPAEADPQPSRADQGAERPAPLTQEQAERILGAAEQDERELYREKLRRSRRESPVLRDW